MADVDRLRLVILGGAGVGKSSIIKRFLFKTYSDKYRATIEDLYSREFYLGGAPLKVFVYCTYVLHIIKIVKYESSVSLYLVCSHPDF